MVRRRHSYLSPKLKARATLSKRGHGVFAREPVEAGELLVVWSGYLVGGEELATLDTLSRHVALQVEEDLFQVSFLPGEPADFVNHSCDPNAGLSGQIALVAMRSIKPGEEICYDYAMSDGCPYDEFKCECNAAICRGWVRGYDWTLAELQLRYRGYFSPYLQHRIERLFPAGMLEFPVQTKIARSRQ